MKKLIWAGIFFAICLAVTVLATSTKTWWYMIAVAPWGYLVFLLVVQFGEEKGYVISEPDLPLEIYQVVAIAMYGRSAVALLRNAKRKLVSCKSSILDGGFDNFTIEKEADGQQYFVPKTLGDKPMIAPAVAPEVETA